MSKFEIKNVSFGEAKGHKNATIFTSTDELTVTDEDKLYYITKADLAKLRSGRISRAELNEKMKGHIADHFKELATQPD